jgi:hypothetical protein
VEETTLQRPACPGLSLCELVIVEASTGYVSLINCFDRRLVRAFPARLPLCAIHATLSFGFVPHEVHFTVTRMPDLRPVFTTSQRLQFNSPQHVVRFITSGEVIESPAAGWDELDLHVGEVRVAQSLLELIAEEDEP